MQGALSGVGAAVRAVPPSGTKGDDRPGSCGQADRDEAGTTPGGGAAHCIHDRCIFSRYLPSHESSFQPQRLRHQNLLIADDEKGIALAGVMGDERKD
jgi:hypothetical protein